MTATICTDAKPYFTACRDSRRSYSSFVKARAEEALWRTASRGTGPVRTAAKHALIDLGVAWIERPEHST